MGVAFLGQGSKQRICVRLSMQIGLRYKKGLYFPTRIDEKGLISPSQKSRRACSSQNETLWNPIYFTRRDLKGCKSVQDCTIKHVDWIFHGVWTMLNFASVVPIMFCGSLSTVIRVREFCTCPVSPMASWFQIFTFKKTVLCRSPESFMQRF